MGTVLAIANQKGGVGKTTTAVNLGASIADAGYPILLVDLDPQCNATVALGMPKDHSPNVYDCVSGDRAITELAIPTGIEHLEVVPSTPELAGANVELPRIAGSETILRERLGDVRERYLFALLDCPPSLGPLTVNALVAADRVIVPVQAEYLALEGLVQFLDTLGLVRAELNPGLVLTGVVITMHDERTRLAQDVERELRGHFPDLVFETVIPRSVRLAEAPSFGVPVFEHAPASRGSTAYRELAAELAVRERADWVAVEHNPEVEVDIRVAADRGDG
jgi:chromosome partitioning protein